MGDLKDVIHVCTCFVKQCTFTFWNSTTLCICISPFYAQSIKGNNSWRADLHCWIAGRHCVTGLPRHVVAQCSVAMLWSCVKLWSVALEMIKMQCACDGCRQSPVSKATWSLMMTWKKQKLYAGELRSQVVVVIATLRDHRFLIPTNRQIGFFFNLEPVKFLSSDNMTDHSNNSV